MPQPLRGNEARPPQTHQSLNHGRISVGFAVSTKIGIDRVILLYPWALQQYKT